MSEPTSAPPQPTPAPEKPPRPKVLSAETVILQRVGSKGHVNSQVAGISVRCIEGDMKGCQPIVCLISQKDARGELKPNFALLKLMTGSRATWRVKKVDVDGDDYRIRCHYVSVSN